MEEKKLGLIFDMDGTLIDNMQVHYEAWYYQLKKLGFNFTLKEVQQKIHGTNSEILKTLYDGKISEVDIKKIANEKELQYRQIFENKICLIEGLENFLENCLSQKIPMAIGTAAPAENVNFGVQKLKLDRYFKTIIHADMVKKGKPHPEVFLNACKEMGLTPNQIIVFEDSPTGAKTAVNANMKSIIINTFHQIAEFENISHIQKFINNYHQINLKELISYLYP